MLGRFVVKSGLGLGHVGLLLDSLRILELRFMMWT